MKKIIIGTIFFSVLSGAVLWEVFRKPETLEPVKEEITVQETKPQEKAKPKEEESQTDPTSNLPSSVPPSGMGAGDGGSFPEPTTEVVNGRTERTIHVGVRQWEWDPNVLRAKQGELVRLIIHNADVNHPLYIPELGIEAEVPPEGAVVEFEAKKKGSFFFLCGTYCGVGHAEMQGTLIIE